MARPLRIEYENAFYHITARGNERKSIFTSRKDHEKFLYYLGLIHKRYKIKQQGKGVRSPLLTK